MCNLMFGVPRGFITLILFNNFALFFKYLSDVCATIKIDQF